VSGSWSRYGSKIWGRLRAPVGSGVGSGFGFGVGSGVGSGAGKGVAAELDSSVGSAVRVRGRFGSGCRRWFRSGFWCFSGVDSDVRFGVGFGVSGSWSKFGSKIRGQFGSGCRRWLGSGSGVGSGVGLGVGSGVGKGVGAELDPSVGSGVRVRGRFGGGCRRWFRSGFWCCSGVDWDVRFGVGSGVSGSWSRFGSKIRGRLSEYPVEIVRPNKNARVRKIRCFGLKFLIKDPKHTLEQYW
jgi:hypothetical protein